MTRALLILVLLFTNCEMAFSQSFRLRATNFYTFPTDVETIVTKWDGKNLNLKISEIEDEDEIEFYPLGSEFIGRVIKDRKAKRFFRDEYMIIQVNNIKYPDGRIAAEDLKFKLRARPGILNKEKIGNTLVGTTALVLGTVFDATVVGLPISRGGYAIWYSVQEMQDRKDESKWKTGSIGFIKGALFPIPQMLSPGKDLTKMVVGSRVSIDRERKGRSVDAYLRSGKA